jgi:transcription initiation factor IIE alpha subunit
MDLANTLIRSVVRAFYETRQILVVDALFRHSVYDSIMAALPCVQYFSNS